MNPCRLRILPDRNRCHCTLKTRFTIILERCRNRSVTGLISVLRQQPVSYEEIKPVGRNRSLPETIRKRVERVRKIQEERFRGLEFILMER